MSPKNKREGAEAVKRLESEICGLERDLARHFTDITFQNDCKLKFLLQEMYNQKKGRKCTV